MDDRDFIYWLHGIMEYGNFETLKTDLIDQIMDNICEVYDNVHNKGIMNDFDAMRIISFIEGALMYYDDASIEHKVKVCRLIKNELFDLYARYQDKKQHKMPLYKQDYITFSPYEEKIVKNLSYDETSKILDAFKDIFFPKPKEEKKIIESSEEKDKQDQSEKEEQTTDVVQDNEKTIPVSDTKNQTELAQDDPNIYLTFVDDSTIADDLTIGNQDTVDDLMQASEEASETSETLDSIVNNISERA